MAFCHCNRCESVIKWRYDTDICLKRFWNAGCVVSKGKEAFAPTGEPFVTILTDCGMVCKDTLFQRVSRLMFVQLPAGDKGDDPKGGRGNPKIRTKVRISPALPHGSPPWTLFPFTLSPLFRTFHCLQMSQFVGSLLLPFLGGSFVRPDHGWRFFYYFDNRTSAP